MIERKMMNLLALGLVLSTLLAAEVWSPIPAMNTHHTASEGDVIVKDGHHRVVVEYDRDGKTNTRILISPPSENHGEDEEGKGTIGGSLFRDAKDKAKEAASHLPQMGQGISQPEAKSREETEEAREHQATAGEVICDAFGKCRQKIVSVVGRGKDPTADTVGDIGETASEARDAATGKAYDDKETVARAARDAKETVSDKAEDAKDKVSEKAYDVKESVADKAQYAKDKVGEKVHYVKESVAHKSQAAKERVAEKAGDVKESVANKAHESKETVKDRAMEKAHELKEKAARMSQSAWERTKTAARGLRSTISQTFSLTNVGSVLGLTGIAASFGTCLWVTFVSSYVLASVLGRQQFGVLQSKLYPVYFKLASVGILVGLLSHLLSRRKKILSDAPDMWQAVNLLASFFLIEANKSFVEPRATKAMFERMKAEKEEGRGGEKTSELEVRRKLETLSERLSKLNTYSSWLNILMLVSLTWHLVYLGQRLAAC